MALFQNGLMPALRNNSDTLLQTGIGLIGGRTANEQAMMGLQGFQQGRKQTQTMNFLRQNSPELAEAVASGALSGSDAFKMFYQKKLEAEKPKQPMVINGKIVDPDTYGVIADFSDPEKGPQPTGLMRELEAAGLEPGSPEYQQAILEAKKPRGMTVESDGQGGFRMVQGADVSGGANLNVEQGKNTGFLLRATDANKEISTLESEGTSAWNKAMQNVGPLGNYGLGADAQKLQQAKRDFVNAVLRQESGAVISEEEFANAEQQYFPQPGDGPEVIAQKRRNRENAIAGFRIRSGPGAGVVDQQQPGGGGVQDYTDYFK